MASMARRTVGVAMVAYAALYTIQVVFGILYADALPASDVYRVFSYLTAAGILVSVAVAWCRKRGCGSRPPSGCTSRLLRTLRLAIWFFTLWFRRRRSRTVNPSRIPTPSSGSSSQP